MRGDGRHDAALRFRRAAGADPTTGACGPNHREAAWRAQIVCLFPGADQCVTWSPTKALESMSFAKAKSSSMAQQVLRHLRMNLGEESSLGNSPIPRQECVVMSFPASLLQCRLWNPSHAPRQRLRPERKSALRPLRSWPSSKAASSAGARRRIGGERARDHACSARSWYTRLAPSPADHLGLHRKGLSNATVPPTMRSASFESRVLSPRRARCSRA